MDTLQIKVNSSSERAFIEVWMPAAAERFNRDRFGATNMIRFLAIAYLLSTAPAWTAGQPRGEMHRGGRVQSSSPFHAIGVYWHDRSIGSVQARASMDGRTWTPWIRSSAEWIEGDRMGSGLIYFGEGYRQVEVDGVTDPDVLLIDPGPSPAPPGTAPGSRMTEDNPPPTMVSREQWGCTPQTCPAQDPALYTTVTHLIVHHTDGNNTAPDWSAVVRSIWVLHVKGNGWNDIGYNYLIDPNGLLYEGRAGGDGVLGAHFSGVNSGTMGVALLGTFIDVTPPAPMLTMLENMLAWQASKWHVDPSGERLHTSSGLVLNVISGHRDANISPAASGTTECPGNTAYTWLPQIRQNVLAKTFACILNVGERNRCVPSVGGLLFAAEMDSLSCSSPLTITSNADWVTAGADLPILTVAPNDGARRAATVDIGGRSLAITQAGKGEGLLPCIAMRGIVNGADFDARPVVAGSQAAVFGEGLGEGATAAVNGKPVAVEFAGPGQVNLNIPSNLNLGTNHLTITVDGVTGPQVNFWVTEAMPAIFSTSGFHAVAVNADDGALNTPSTPVKAGSDLTVYLTGVGMAASFPWSATVGGSPAGRRSLSLAPLIIGVYQAGITIPSGLAPREHPLALTVNGVTSREAMVSIGN